VNMPGFTAEVSIGKTKEHYEMIAILNMVDRPLYQAQLSIVEPGYHRLGLLENSALVEWPIYVLGRPIIEPTCICLRLDSQGRCLRWLCF
jgi:hypothetical protein